MRRHATIAVFTLFAGSAVAVAAHAQDRDSVTVRRRSPDRTFVYSFGPEDHFVMRRGRLGITVDLRADRGRDSIGALVSGVTPNGPADQAGVHSGDIITRLNGTRLVSDNNRSSDDDVVQSRPGMRLINLASRLDQGDTVRLDLLRENRPLTVTFTAAETDMDQLVERMRIPGPGGPGGPGAQWFQFNAPGMQGMSGFPGMGDAPNIRVFTNMNGLGDVELIRVSPELAQALSISEGVLVADAGSDTTLGLKTGDVITSIGGRRPTSPAHAMRILSSYESGEAVQFEVMRRGRRATVSGHMPVDHDAWRIQRNNFEFTMPRMPVEPFRQWMEEGGPRIKIEAPAFKTEAVGRV